MRIGEGSVPARTASLPSVETKPKVSPGPRRGLADSFERAPAAALWAVPKPPAARGQTPLLGAGGTPSTFVCPETRVPPGTTPASGPQASPEQAVAYLVQLDLAGLERASQANVFVQLLEPRRDDPDWLRAFYGSLGTERAARLVNDALSFESYRDWPSATAQQHVEIVQASLASLHQAQGLDQGDMDALLEQWTAGPGRFNPGLALAFAQLGHEAEPLKNLFVGSAVRLATGTLDGDAAADVAAAAAWVLARTSPDNQMAVLDEIRQQDLLAPFIDRALRGPTVVPTILNSTQDAFDPLSGTWNHPIETAYDGLARIVFNLAYAGARDSFQGPPPLSAAELSRLRTEVFAEAVKALGDEREGTWARNTFLKDGLSRIFVEDNEAILSAILSENRATFRREDRRALLHGMQGLFQNALFTPPLGHESRRLLSFMAETLAGMAQDVRGVDRGGLTDDEVAAKYGADMDRVRLTHLSGLLTGCLMSGLRQAERAVEADAKAAANALAIVLKIGLSFVPGASTLAGLGGTALGKILDGLSSEALSAVRNMTVEEAEKYLVERGLARLDARAAVEELERLAAGKVHLYGEWSEAFESGLGEN